MAGRLVFGKEVQMTDGKSHIFIVYLLLTLHTSINWSGSALSTFYAAIRKALVVVLVARALGILFGIAFAGWWIFKH